MRNKNRRVMRLSAKHLLALINGVLDLQKIEAECMEVNPTPCDVVEIVQRAVDEFTVPTREKGLELHCKIEPPELPLVLLDGIHLKQIVTNVISNAVKHTDSVCRREEMSMQSWQRDRLLAHVWSQRCEAHRE